jgi:hypothetical protein
MTRKYSDTLKAEIEAAIIDNTSQQISAADVRQLLLDIIDSLRPSWAALAGDHTAAPVTFGLTNVWQTINAAGMYTTAGASDADELAALQSTGQLDVKFGSWNHLIDASMNFEAPNGQEVQFSIAVDGAPVGMIATIDGAGAGRVIEMSDWALVFPPTSSKVTVMARVPAGTANITIHQVQLYGQLTTTRYP